MSRLRAIQLDDNTSIYIEVSEEINTPVIHAIEAEQMRSSRSATPQQLIQNLANLQYTIKAFAVYMLNYLQCQYR